MEQRYKTLINALVNCKDKGGLFLAADLAALSALLSVAEQKIEAAKAM